MTERELFVAALAIDEPAARNDYLAAACGSDLTLRSRVDRLLATLNRVGDFLQSPPAADALLGLPAQRPTDLSGSTIGSYKLLEQIGEGGMGTVWLAQQQRPVRRKVALKLIKPGMDSKQVIARFEAERQALALMDHPHIARIHDAGTTDAGRPYFVMELVRGVPITEYCDRRRLDLRQRLTLFVQVCQAVQHAHTKGVIHRDLKPGNVLVAHDDVVAVPKVIDFGIAKATSQPLTERTLHTGLVQMVGTPLYMSPEQAALHQHDVDTRSDVYSLGVLLYELLTGTTPFDSEVLKKADYDEIRRIIREEESPRPSDRVTTVQAHCTAECPLCQGRPRELAGSLRGELDWVVLRALEKDRDRRYQSASALAADVQRYLEDEPVEACPPSGGYRLRKYWRRNRRVLVTAGMFAAVLVTATVVSVWQAVKARDAQRQAEAAEGRATTEAAIATAISDFLQRDLLQQADIYVQRSESLAPERNLTVKEALDRAAARIGQRFQDQPVVEAAIQMTIGVTYRNVGEYRLAMSHLERAVALRKAHLGPAHRDTIGSVQRLAEAYRYVCRHSDAITLYQQALEECKALLGPDHPETLECVQSLAIAYAYAGQLKTTSQLLEYLVEKCRTLFGPTHSSTLANMHHLAWNYAHMDRLTESIALHDKVLELHKSVVEPQNDPPISWLGSLALVCQWAGDLDRANRLHREVLDHVRRQDESRMRHNRMASRLAFLALTLLLQGRPDEAEPFAREAVGLNQIEEYQRFYSVSILGAVLLGQRKYAEAEPLLLQGYQGLKQNEAIHPAVRRWRKQVGEWVVRLYEATGQQESADVA